MPKGEDAAARASSEAHLGGLGGGRVKNTVKTESQKKRRYIKIKGYHASRAVPGKKYCLKEKKGINTSRRRLDYLDHLQKGGGGIPSAP